MGNVVQIHSKEASRGADPVEGFVRDAYRRLVALGDFSERPGQAELSIEIGKSALASKTLVAEAPTGTGKTIAYLIGMLAAANTLDPKRPLPIVVATATVGLQSQILTGDLPRLARANIVDFGSFALAKGRGRYFCPNSAQRYVAGKQGSTQADFFVSPDEQDATYDVTAAEEMLAEWSAERWDGDFDSYAGMPVVDSSRVAAMAHTCIGHKCEFYNSCPFFSSRRVLSQSRVLIANHDLVLADLKMSKEGQDPLFPGHTYLCVFDEAHHLPAKAQAAGGASIRVENVIEDLSKWHVYRAMWSKHDDVMAILKKAKLDIEMLNVGHIQGALEELAKVLAPHCQVEPTHRFPRGALPGELTRILKYLEDKLLPLCDDYYKAQKGLGSTNLAEKSPFLSAVLNELMYLGAHLMNVLEQLRSAARLIQAEGEFVRWLEVNEAGTKIACIPIEAGPVLQDLLWDTTRARVAMVSATVRDFDGFAHFKHATGHEVDWNEMVLEPVLPYHLSEMRIVNMQHSPRQESRQDYIRELHERMPEHINPSQGTLVLFPSKALMRATVQVLRNRFKDAVLVQGEVGIKELVARHTARIESGKGSILCGLDTLAEGLDLPGKLCEHVVICALPFASPVTPLEQELTERLGSEYFARRALPHTLIKLTQMVGRLVRRQSDTGVITVFDQRLAYTRWGRKMVGALPKFRFRVVQGPVPRLVVSNPT